MSKLQSNVQPSATRVTKVLQLLLLDGVGAGGAAAAATAAAAGLSLHTADRAPAVRIPEDG